ncbi:lytic transglycosylase domain-containing protein [Rhodoferax sp.]|uniref:lytic transglycosylase domain-containing protein n=1 Tax=Rhodoferax sp. TaxID=50421 RepID=UPI002637F179|nr:lytic transglycosylase domain-containing protein [Rhodoferax sp.]MDD2924966.1 lytic transglycosylase domain-containing protein [Rhodoferax sp.]
MTYFEISPGVKAVRHHVREASRSFQIDFELLQAIIATESGFDPRAVSPKGAIGLMQLMPATAERFGVVADKKTSVEKKLADPSINIRAGSRYLNYLLGLFAGQVELAVAAYNAGEGAVQRAGNRIPNFSETQNYVKTVMQLYQLLKPPAQLVGRRGAANSAGGRVQMTIGGAVNRGAMPPTLLPLGSALTLIANRNYD